MRVLIAPDKFKGTLDAAAAADAIAEGVREACPNAEIDRAPMADGGEGTVAALVDACGGRWVEVTTSDAMGAPIQARYAMLADGTAAIELAEASGLWRIGPDRRDPLRASTLGTGELLRHALQAAPKQVWICIGGSATNDGGAGIAAALGARFLDQTGSPIHPLPCALESLARIDSSGVPILPPITVLCDVRNPLLGPDGASRIYGPQKGAGPAAIDTLERTLTRFADVCGPHFGYDHRTTPGAGAAGGAGFGLLTFGAASLRPGFEVVAAATDLEARIAAADIVITGEGALDAQTDSGKAPAGVAAMAAKLGRLTYAITGAPCAGHPAFACVVSAAECAEKEGHPGGSVSDPARWVRAAAAILARGWG
jgi:glycerate kinase